MRALVAVVVGVMLVWAQPVRADEPSADEQKAAELYQQGKTHFDLAEYDKAIEAFKESYKLSKLPILLYNIAQAYRQMGDCENALTFYKNYLRNDPDADNRAKVEQRIAEMDTCVKDPNHKKPVPDVKPDVAPPDVKQPDVKQPDVKPDVKQPEVKPPVEEPHGARGGGKKIAGYVTGGVGAVLIGMGVYYTGVAKDKQDQVEKGCTPGCDWANEPELRAADSDGKAAQRNSIILYSVGGAALVGGAVLYFWGAHDAKASDTHVSVAPGDGGGMLVVDGVF